LRLTKPSGKHRSGREAPDVDGRSGSGRRSKPRSKDLSFLNNPFRLTYSPHGCPLSEGVTDEILKPFRIACSPKGESRGFL
jgi:hypothetical protein